MEMNLDLRILHYVLTNMEDALCLTNTHGEILYANTAAQRLLEISAGPDRPPKIWEVFPFVEQNDELLQLIIDTVQKRLPFRQTLVDYENKEGKLFRFRVCMEYMEAGSDYLVIIINDLTELTKVNDAFARYTSPRIADYVLHTPGGSEQGGETRDITVLMSDLRGFTAMSTVMAPSHLIRMLNHYFEKVVDIIEHFRGNVIEFLGDGLFVIFNAPNDDPDHAAHAVACAVEMQNAMDEVNRWNLAEGYPELSMGIGIGTGPAVVGNIGSAQRMKYGCVGETVNLAGRMEKLSVGGQIVISEEVRRQIREPLLVLKSQKYLPKGGREPITIYDVAGIGEDHRMKHTVDKQVWRKTAREEKITCYLLNEAKGVEETPYTAWVTDVSEDGRYVRLRAEEGFEPAGDLMVDCRPRLYGKVVGNEEGLYTLCLTSAADLVDAWMKTLL